MFILSGVRVPSLVAVEGPRSASLFRSKVGQRVWVLILLGDPRLQPGDRPARSSGDGRLSAERR